jgi:hypothetical protein
MTYCEQYSKFLFPLIIRPKIVYYILDLKSG